MTRTRGNSAVRLSLASSNRPNKPLPKWMMHCKWGTCVYKSIYTRSGIFAMERGGSAYLYICTCRRAKENIADEVSREEEDLATLSSLGHFLKGSSATLGLTKVKDSCEKIQHYGQKKDEAGTTDEPDEKKCLDRIKETLAAVKDE